MAGLIDRFKKNIAGARDIIVDFTSKITAKGDFEKITELQVILNSWRNILLTPLETASHDPTYGSNLYKYVFAQNDSKTIEAIKHEIQYRLTSQDDRAKITNIEVTTLPNLKGLNVKVGCNYKGLTGDMVALVDQNTFNILDN